MNSIRIDGATRLFGIVGDPIIQARSPAVYTELFAQRGLPAVMVPLHVLARNIGQAADLFGLLENLDGVLVTAPFKTSLLSLATSIGPAAECVGALNALRRRPDGGWHGDMFDGQGFVVGAKRQGIELAGRRAHLFGAGGAGSAIAYELAVAGVRSIDVADPDELKVRRLCDAIQLRVPACDVRPARGDFDCIDLLVNASTVGMGGAPGLPGKIPPLGPSIAVGEVNVTAEGTDLVKLARAAGSPWVDGAAMHAGQIDCLMGFLFNQND